MKIFDQYIDSKIMITNPKIDIHGNVVERKIENYLNICNINAQNS